MTTRSLHELIMEPVGIAELLAAKRGGFSQPALRPAPEPGLRGLLGQYIFDAARKAGLSGQANRMRGDAQVGMDFVPGVGEAVGVDDTARAFNAGNYGEAALNGVGTVAGLVPGGDLAAGAAKAIFGGIAAKTANRQTLDLATDMAKKGVDKAEIWDKTGWFKGADGKWRFEIDDSPSKLTPKAADELMAHDGGTRGATQRSAPGVLMHKDLYAAYPDLRTVDVDARYNSRLSNPKGSFVEGASGNGDRALIDVQSNNLEGDPRSIRGIGLHELQHGVQNLEDFGKGGNNFSVFGHSDPKIRAAVQEEMNKLLRTIPKDEYAATLRQSWPEATAADLDESYKGYLKANKDARSNPYHPAAKAAQETAAMSVYRRMAGETEARNVQTRMNMTADQRRATPPWATQDVPDELQIVRRR